MWRPTRWPTTRLPRPVKQLQAALTLSDSPSRPYATWNAPIMHWWSTIQLFMARAVCPRAYQLLTIIDWGPCYHWNRPVTTTMMSLLSGLKTLYSRLIRMRLCLERGVSLGLTWCRWMHSRRVYLKVGRNRCDININIIITNNFII